MPFNANSAWNRLVLLALDSGDPGLIKHWAEQGYLPNLAKLMEEGSSIPIATPPGVLEGAIWPTILTSMEAATHGMYAYKQIVPHSYELQIAMMADRLPSPPFWAHISKSGKRVAVVDAPFALPVKKLNGIQVTNWGGHDLWCAQRCSTPRGLIDELVERFGEYPMPSCDTPGRSLRDFKLMRESLREAVVKKTALLRHCMQMEKWDFFFGVYSESHCAGHQFWHFTDPTHPRYDPEVPDDLRHCIRDVYHDIDAGIGQLLNDLAPDTHVMVLLSHGMGPYYHGSHLLDQVIEALGVNEFSDGKSPSVSQQDRSLPSATWSFRRLLPKPLRETIKSKMPQEWIRRLWCWCHPQSPNKPINPWIHKRVFQLPESNMTGLLRINLKGREPAGLVEPGAEYESLCRRLTNSLLAVENPDTGRKAIQWIWRSRDLYQGPRIEELPDLFIEWDHSAPIKRLRSSEIGTLEREYVGHRTGSHTQGGLLISRGPNFKSGQGEEIRSIDLAPTLLSFFGIPAPSAYEGASRLPLLQKTWAI
jgi:predicted AlkP superfamily phosphohydrolase/phosphomutase